MVTPRKLIFGVFHIIVMEYMFIGQQLETTDSEVTAWWYNGNREEERPSRHGEGIQYIEIVRDREVVEEVVRRVAFTEDA